MHCHLIIPDLLLPDFLGPELPQLPRLPAFETILGRSSHSLLPAQSLEGWLCAAFSVAKQADWPIAPLTLAADGGTPGDIFWLRADPVHLKVMRDQLHLADSATFGLSQLEAEALTDTLNRHFQEDGLIFYPLRPDRWYLRAQDTEALETVALPDAAGKNIDPLLPGGPAGLRWKIIFNEIQMLFHRHQVNAAREEAGQLTINSVWLWGGGRYPTLARPDWAQLWANDSVAHSLASAAGMPSVNLPQSAGAWLESATTQGEHAIVIDRLRGAAQYADFAGWQEALQALEQDWFGPLLAALRNRKLNRLSLTIPQTCGGYAFSLTRSDIWKFWRRIQPVSMFASRALHRSKPRPDAP